MKFKEMFQDDKTGQLSLARVGIALLLVQQLAVCTWLSITKDSNIDMAVGVVGLITLLYGTNKIVSNTTAKG